MPLRNNKINLPASFELKTIDGVMHLVLLSDLNISQKVAQIWREALPEIQKSNPALLVIDALKMKQCDGMGVALLYRIQLLQKSVGGALEIRGLLPKYQSLLDDFSDVDLQSKTVSEIEELSHIEHFGKEFETRIEESKRLIEYIGEIAMSFLSVFRHPRSVRWSEVLKVSEATGVNALPIIALIGFLLGLIMSFQSAIPMQRFGAEIFVANLVSLSLFRELGPLMTAIIMAGRSGSSFAAEIGTMKVSEELDALNTMGLNPVQFLIIPKIIAAMIVSPLLTLFFNLLGLVGSALVIISFGYPLVTFMNQAAKSVRYMDMAGGLFKSAVFGLLVASIGCLSGLQTREGASAVGESTTKAVVTGIIVIATTDGIFSVFFYLLGI